MASTDKYITSLKYLVFIICDKIHYYTVIWGLLLEECDKTEKINASVHKKYVSVNKCKIYLGLSSSNYRWLSDFHSKSSAF